VDLKDGEQFEFEHFLYTILKLMNVRLNIILLNISLCSFIHVENAKPMNPIVAILCFLAQNAKQFKSKVSAIARMSCNYKQDSGETIQKNFFDWPFHIPGVGRPVR